MGHSRASLPALSCAASIFAINLTEPAAGRACAPAIWREQPLAIVLPETCRGAGAIRRAATRDKAAPPQLQADWPSAVRDGPSYICAVSYRRRRPPGLTSGIVGHEPWAPVTESFMCSRLSNSGARSWPRQTAYLVRFQRTTLRRLNPIFGQ